MSTMMIFAAISVFFTITQMMEVKNLKANLKLSNQYTRHANDLLYLKVKYRSAHLRLIGSGFLAAFFLSLIISDLVADFNFEYFLKSDFNKGLRTFLIIFSLIFGGLLLIIERKIEYLFSILEKDKLQTNLISKKILKLATIRDISSSIFIFGVLTSMFIRFIEF